jgi:hypothetical protein
MKNTWIDYIIFSLTVLLIFFIAFRNAIDVPALLVPAARMHPVILHFPIVLVILAVYRTWKNGSPGTMLLGATTIVTLATAISGMLLYRENGAGGNTVINHMWTGSALGLAMAIWFWSAGRVVLSKILQRGLISLVFLLVLATGHLGGTVTHGSDFLAWPKREKPIVSTGDPEVFSDLVLAVLNEKCASCHNSQKKKGGLMLTDHQSIRTGGDNGPAIAAGDPEESLIIRRMALPLEDEKHMPPAGKLQPSEQDIALIRAWIAAGTPASIRYSQLDPASDLYRTVANFMDEHAENNNSWHDLQAIEEDMIQSLTNDYRTIKRVYGSGNALSVSVYPHADYGPDMVTDLRSIQGNIIEFDASGLPLGKDEIEWISNCAALERLDLDNTPIEDGDMQYVANIKTLKHIKLHNTSLSDHGIAQLASLPELKFLYLWNTKTTEDGILKLKRSNPALYIDTGIEMEAFIVRTDSSKVGLQQAAPVK